MGRIDQDTDQVRSIRVGKASVLFEQTTFPTTTETIIDDFGYIELEYPRGSEPLRAILERSGYETYVSRNMLESAILNGVRRDAVGRPRYSDRGDERDEAFNRPIQSF